MFVGFRDSQNTQRFFIYTELIYYGKAIPVQALKTGPWGSKRLRLVLSRHEKIVRLSALRTGRFYPLEIFLVLIFVHATGRIMSMKNSIDTIATFHIVAQRIHLLPL